ncbi:hypothetical protein BKA67DRAFT_685682 [Truncatella angustata]|uniref:Amine oxidase n=1 Tax=Truncatella angustata TaxID=152316 RepID=A0A9P8UVR9_9PEZI|nr:uncharacterized protein BKA67DRAFT_685682 [Truncatella angustata]KAH6659085.1 hypothetical protein BKA67DRAFT_685682 [Truncatella angustata]KAH8201233.1 hypothetical protein TruAng_004623 [Truncatella angustata]
MQRSKEGYIWTPTSEVEGIHTASVVPSSSHIRDAYDVIVIGSGFAGLIAARDISQHSKAKVLLLEARDRIGGRTWTARVDNEDIEMGGTWVHWNQPHVYTELHRYGIHKSLKTSAGTVATQVQYHKRSGSTVESLVPAEVKNICDKVAADFFQIDSLDSRALMPYPHDPLREPTPWKKYDHMSIADRLKLLHNVSSFDKAIFETMTASFGSAPGSDIGFCEALRWFALGGHTMGGVFELVGVFKLGNGGTTSLATLILKDFQGDVLLNSPVGEISQYAAGAIVTTKAARRITAKIVISTIPLNVLGDVIFTPPLSPLRHEAIVRGHINKGAKIHFKLGDIEPGWFATCEKGSPYVFAFSDHNGTRPWGPDGTWCIGFGYNGCLEDKKNSSEIVRQFRQNIRPDADVKLYATHDWMNDAYAKGVWSCWGPNSSTAHWAELQRSHGRVLFASADWADGWRGFIDGAIEQGRRAATDVVEFLLSESANGAKL